MALIHSFEKSGNQLFRYRGQIPLFIFITAIPVIFLTDYKIFNDLFYLILTLISVFVGFTGFFIRAYTIGTTPKGTSGRNTKEQVAESINTKGIYSVVRHPLYVGNYLMWLGLLIFTFNVYYVLIISLFFWIYYERIMFAEERFLQKKYGDVFMCWSEKVPAFIPALGKFEKSDIRVSVKSVLRREYSGILAMAVGYFFIDHLRNYVTYHQFEPFRISTWVLSAAIILVLVLRTLKHRGILDESGRS
mgnify:CR=1 FL=1